MSNKFRMGLHTITFGNTGLKIISKENNNEKEILYSDLNDITITPADGGMFKEEIDGSLNLITGTNQLKLPIEKSDNLLAQALLNYYKENISSANGRKLGIFRLINFLGIEDHKKNEAVLIHIYDDKIGFAYSDKGECEWYNFVDIEKIEFVEHMQFMHGVSLASTLVIGDIAPAVFGKDELAVIEMLVLTIKKDTKARKIILGQSKETDYDLKYVYDFLDSVYNK